MHYGDDDDDVDDVFRGTLSRRTSKYTRSQRKTNLPLGSRIRALEAARLSISPITTVDRYYYVFLNFLKKDDKFYRRIEH